MRHNDTSGPAGPRWRNAHAILLVVVVALAAGAPSLRGGFLAGDDIQLVRDHVLVNHPSPAHMAKLFDPAANRDLYQPIPLVTFAVNFAIMHGLGLTADVTGPRAGAWVFHLTNVLLHGFNAVLVWWLLARLCRNRFVPVAAAVLFAAHPLNVEVVAWLNGRMMLTSTLFALAALIAFDAHLTIRRWWPAAASIVFVALAMMCKVRVGLPLLMLILPLQRRLRPAWQTWVAWGVATAITGVFLVVNVRMSSGILEAGSQALSGSGTVRVSLALGWYLAHYVVPSGLAPWYPVPNPAVWSDPALPAAALVVAMVFAATLVSLRWTRTGVLGMGWFLVTIAATLPFVPTRNLLVADRYMYLPAIGLHWVAAAIVWWVVVWLRGRFASRGAVPVLGVVLGLVVVAGLATDWRNARFYRTSVDRGRRIAQRFPDEPGVWERLAKSCYSAGQYAEAIEAAQTELDQHPKTAVCSTGQLVGMSLYRLGRVDEGIAALESAAASDPEDGMVQARLATVYNELGRSAEAVEHYERTVALMPGYNPSLVSLGKLYQRLGQFESARRVFEQALTNNEYEFPAIVGLAEIEMQAGQHAEAARRLERLLSWMPENAAARTDLGVCYVSLGRRADAMRAYREAIERDPSAIEAAVNLAGLLAESGDVRAAAATLKPVLASFPSDRRVLAAYHDLLVGQGQFGEAVALWAAAVGREPSASDLRGWYAWAAARAGEWELARREAENAIQQRQDEPMALAAQVLVALNSGDPATAAARAERIIGLPVLKTGGTVDRLLGGLEGYTVLRTDDPFPYYVAAAVLASRGEIDAASKGVEVFKQLCPDPAWHERADALLAPVTSSRPAG